ncbi:hypothetical protein Q7P36_010149 [Cladosporium allicinum]|jgi:hypothetical protein
MASQDALEADHRYLDESSGRDSTSDQYLAFCVGQILNSLSCRRAEAPVTVDSCRLIFDRCRQFIITEGARNATSLALITTLSYREYTDFPNVCDKSEPGPVSDEKLDFWLLREASKDQRTESGATFRG